MRRSEREVKDRNLIMEMLKIFNKVTIGLNDEDGIPYLVPVNFGFSFDENNLYIYGHCAKQGKKINLIRSDNRCCLNFSAFSDFPDHKYENHYHDYRSITAKGTIELLEFETNPEEFEKGYNLLYTCNSRDIKPLSERKAVPPIYIMKISCPFSFVSAKSEFPINSKEDIPLKHPQ